MTVDYHDKHGNITRSEDKNHVRAFFANEDYAMLDGVQVDNTEAEQVSYDAAMLEKRSEEYKDQADKIFFESERAERPVADWTDKVTEIKTNHKKWDEV